MYGPSYADVRQGDSPPPSPPLSECGRVNACTRLYLGARDALRSPLPRLCHGLGLDPPGRRCAGRRNPTVASLRRPARSRGARALPARGDDAPACRRRPDHRRIRARKSAAPSVVAVPQRIVVAFLSAEDRHFYEHGGIDPIGNHTRPARQPRQRRGPPAGRLDDHPAGRQEPAAVARADLQPQDQGDPPRLPYRGDLQQGPHPRAVPQRDLLRHGPLRLAAGALGYFTSPCTS